MYVFTLEKWQNEADLEVSTCMQWVIFESADILFRTVHCSENGGAPL